MDNPSFAERKVVAAHRLLEISDASILSEIEKLLVVIPVQRDIPCQYSDEEVKERLDMTSRNAVTGKGLSMSDVEKRMQRWIS